MFAGISPGAGSELRWSTQCFSSHSLTARNNHSEEKILPDLGRLAHYTAALVTRQTRDPFRPPLALTAWLMVTTARSNYRAMASYRSPARSPHEISSASAYLGRFSKTCGKTRGTTMKPDIRHCTDFLEQRNRPTAPWTFTSMPAIRQISRCTAIDCRRCIDPSPTLHRLPGAPARNPS